MSRRIVFPLFLLLASAIAAPAAVPDWPVLQEQFKYDQAAPLAVETVKEGPGLAGTELALRFMSANNEKVSALLMLPPADVKPPYPCLLVLHGLGGSKSDARAFAPLALPKGYALLALDAQYHGERKREGKSLVSADFGAMRQAFVQTIVDYRRGLDYLATRPDIDSKRIGLVGASLGGIMGGVLTAVEPRIKTSVLIVGGGDWRTLLAKSTNDAAVRLRELTKDLPPSAMDPLDLVDPIYYVGHISPRPLLMQNGRKDDVVLPACAQAMWERAQQPKAIDWYDSGHVPPLVEVFLKTMSWFGKYL